MIIVFTNVEVISDLQEQFPGNLGAQRQIRVFSIKSGKNWTQRILADNYIEEFCCKGQQRNGKSGGCGDTRGQDQSCKFILTREK